MKKLGFWSDFSGKTVVDTKSGRLVDIDLEAREDEWGHFFVSEVFERISC